MSIEVAKTKLQNSLERLEEVIDQKVTYLEHENTTLRAEIIKIKQELKRLMEERIKHAREFEARAELVTAANKVASVSTQSEKTSKSSANDSKPDLLSDSASSEIDLSLNKLKKLVG